MNHIGSPHRLVELSHLPRAGRSAFVALTSVFVLMGTLLLIAATVWHFHSMRTSLALFIFGSVFLSFSVLFAYVVSAHDSLRNSGYVATDPPTWASEHSYLAFYLLAMLCLVAGALCELNGLSLRDTDYSLALFMLLEGTLCFGGALIFGFVGWSESLRPISSGE